MSSPTEAFEHGAGFDVSTLALTLAGLADTLLLLWMVWVAWSGYRGMRTKRVSKEQFRRMVFRAIFIFLILQWFLYYGVSS